MLNDRERDALEKHEQEAWVERMKHARKTDFRKFLVFLSEAIEIGLANFLINNHLELNCLIVPVTIAINTYILNKLDKSDEIYWQKN